MPHGRVGSALFPATMPGATKGVGWRAATGSELVGEYTRRSEECQTVHGVLDRPGQNSTPPYTRDPTAHHRTPLLSTQVTSCNRSNRLIERWTSEIEDG